MQNNYRIVFLTFHNWETKRQGGFHKFAETSGTGAGGGSADFS
jgi:hypothetical protein